MSYIQLTYDERVTLSALMQQGLSVANIAERLGRHRSTLYRELDRNRCHVTDGAYSSSLNKKHHAPHTTVQETI